MSESDWKYFYTNYPVNRELIWLNNCGTTPAASSILRDVGRYLENYSQRGVLSEAEKYPSVKRRITSILAKLIHCKESEIGIIHNTSEGMNFISHGLDLKAGDKILLLENEYPSNIYPFDHWKEKGVELDFIPISQTPAGFLKNFNFKLSSNVKVVSLSAVHWCTGMPLPLKEIGEICKKKKIELIIDGAQGVGLVDIDVVDMNITAMAFPAWKWLLGPLGVGVIYVKSEKLATMKTIFKGQNSVVNAEEYLPYKSELKPGADRFEYSTCNFTDWIYFKGSLEMLDRVGFDSIRERIYIMAEYLVERIRRKGYSLYRDNFPELKTGIIVFDKPGVDSAAILNVLKENDIVAALRLGRIRMAPHVYNSHDQLDKVVKILSSF